jgi:hypothetical protein
MVPPHSQNFTYLHIVIISQDGSVYKVTGCGLDVRGLIGGRCKVISFLYYVQTGYGIYIASYPILSPELKRMEREADHSPPPSSEANNVC